MATDAPFIPSTFPIHLFLYPVSVPRLSKGLTRLKAFFNAANTVANEELAMSRSLCLTRQCLGLMTRIECVIRPLSGDNGMWTFPDLAHDETLRPKVLAMCEQYPDLSHNQIADKAKDVLSISRSMYYRLLMDQVCYHNSHIG